MARLKKRFTNPKDEPTQTVVVRDYFPVDFAFDDESGAGVLPLRVRRFNRSQMQDFAIGWSRIQHPASARAIYRTMQTDEQAKDEQGQFVLPDEEIRRRRLAEMSVPDYEAFLAQEQAEFVEMIDFCIAAVTDHVWVGPALEDGRPVRVMLDRDGERVQVLTGAQLAEMFAGNGEMLGRITKVLHDENTLTPEKKRLSKQLSVSTRSLLERLLAAPGRLQAATAGAAVPAGSASIAPASAVRRRRRSGRTGR